MNFFRDQQFLESLTTPAALDARLAELKNTRKLLSLAAGFNAVAYFAVFFMEVSAARISGGKATLATSMVLAAAVFPMIKAAIAHGEIRTLLMFRHLSDLSKATTE